MPMKQNSFFRVTLNLSEESYAYLKNESMNRKKEFIIKEALYHHKYNSLRREKIQCSCELLKEAGLIITLIKIIFFKNDVSTFKSTHEQLIFSLDRAMSSVRSLKNESK